MLEVLRSIVQDVNAAESLNDALDLIVRRVRIAMGTEVCSVYMRGTVGNQFVLSATEGLNADQVGVASLEPGEGLVGQVAEREEPLNLDDAESHPSYQLMPGLGEEQFHSFLGVPIIHQRDVLGVLVVQQRDARRFDDSEEAFLVTMSAQLAAVIAHAKVTGAIQLEQQTGTATAAKISGIAGAPGIAIGMAVVISPEADLYAVPPAQSERAKSRGACF